MEIRWYGTNRVSACNMSIADTEVCGGTKAVCEVMDGVGLASYSVGYCISPVILLPVCTVLEATLGVCRNIMETVGIKATHAFCRLKEEST